MKRRLRAEDSVAMYVIAFGLYQIVGVILAMVMDAESSVYVFLAYSVPQILYIATILIYVKVGKTEFRLLAKEDVKAIHYPLAIALALGLFFFALLPNYGIQKLFDLLGKHPSVTLPSFDSSLNIFLGTVIICILPAIGEELMFRKVFTDGFSVYGGRTAIILSGVLFGLGHLNLAQTFHQIFLGCLLSYLYMKTRNITLTSIVHFINNFLALFLTLFTGPGIWNNLTVLGICFACGGVVLAGSIIYLIMKVPKIEKEKEEKLSPFVMGLTVFLAVMWIVVAIVE